jgi:hypothetical protein
MGLTEKKSKCVWAAFLLRLFFAFLAPQASFAQGPFSLKTNNG